MSATLPLASEPVDRAAHLRKDKAWLETAFARDDVLVLLVRDGEPLLTNQGDGLVWLGAQARTLADHAVRLFLGTDTGGAPVFALGLPRTFSLEASPIAGLGAFTDMRSAAARLGPLDANCAATARSLLTWHDTHGFCACCGVATQPAEAGWRRDCQSCKREHFPRTDPVAIMLAVRGDKCLMGRGPEWPDGFYSCLAGFVEPGETVEQAAVRELYEEAGIRASSDNVEYLFWQPWPFPSSLMIGLIIEADSEAITLDMQELSDARWFSRDEARRILNGAHSDVYCPPKFAIAHHILKSWAMRDN